MRPLLLLICYPLSLIVNPASCQFVIRMTVAIDLHPQNTIDESYVQKVVSLVNDWFRDFDVHIQLMNVTSVLDREHANLSKLYYYFRSKEKVANDHKDFYQIWTVRGWNEGTAKYLADRNSSCVFHNETLGVVSIRDADENLVARRSIQSILTNLYIMEHLQETCLCPNRMINSDHPCTLSPYEDNGNSRAPPCFPELIRKTLTGVNCTEPKFSGDRPSIPICRNGILEDGEECDCFHSDEVCEHCCEMKNKKQRCKYKTDSCRPKTTIPPPKKTTHETTTHPVNGNRSDYTTTLTPATIVTTVNTTSPTKTGNHRKSTIIGIVAGVGVLILLILGLCSLYLLSKSSFFNEPDEGVGNLRQLSLPLASGPPSGSSAPRTRNRSRSRRRS
jgi:hypothetical protein